MELKTCGGYYISQEKEMANIFLKTLEQLSNHVDDIAYQGKKIGRKIFIINFIGSKEECNMKDIIEGLNLPPSTATRQVDYFVKHGFIIRNTPSHNRRIVELKLNKLGKEVYQWFNQHLVKVITTTLQNFSETELSIANKVLREIANHSDLLLIEHKIE
ncbi:MAG: MarR family winged helix-turn-helix transcriptional regulator [Candidatus Kariarchaeaceae archaeon]|jgi:DNA-binding MarR family transcriptional regulator